MISKIVLTTLALGISATATEFSSLQEINPADSHEAIIEKAAHVIPTPRQLAYKENEFIGFIHFGPNTFSGKEWGNGMEDPSSFAPERIDTDQWCEKMKAAGMTMAVMTFKHHDGYVLWQSRYEARQTIKNSPYQNGKGDIAKQLSESCAKYGLKFGIYISPADLYQIESKDGIYGNLSKKQKSVIPTSPADFKTAPSKERTDRPAGAPTFNYEVDDYNRYMLNQLYEMLTDYGPVHEVWFDGAHPKHKGGQTYDYAAWYGMIRKLAPEAVIAVKGPDVRWCGNEGGGTRESEWDVLPFANHPDQLDWPDNTGNDLGSHAKLWDAKYLYYRPTETNTSIRHGWFYRDDTQQQVRTPDDVFDIYERSVGGNSVFLLNIPPNREGQFSKRDSDCLEEVGRRIRSTYGKDLAKGAKISADGLQDNDLNTFWQPASDKGDLTVTFPAPVTLNRFVFQEALGKRGQRIESHVLEAWVNGNWTQVAAGTTVGYKKILRFADVTTDRLRLRITGSRLEPSVAEVSAHYYMQPPLPVLASRDTTGMVTLKLEQASFHGKGGGHKVDDLVIHYTLDGSEPGKNSPVYTKPISLNNGGELRVCSFSGDEAGSVNTYEFGILNDGWKVSASSQQNAEFGADKAVDGDPHTFWHSRWDKSPTDHPHTVTIDTGRKQKMTGITYLTRQDKRVPDGMVEEGYVEVSIDGKSWYKAGSFVFGNLLNEPSVRTYRFQRAANARYLRLVSTKGAQDKPYAAAAEIGILAH